jgi:dephospho-CoA kinase
MLKVIGLTGGIGSGKSTVAQVIRDQGIAIIDADLTARQVTEPGQPAHADIANAWPEVVGADGRIDRRRLACIVFADPESRRRLEAITHPRIRAELATQTSALEAAGHRIAFLEAALLVETGLYRELDGLVVVTANRDALIERVVRRDGCSRESVLARIAAQLPVEEKIRVADYVVQNDSSLDHVREQVLRALEEIMKSRL